MQGESATKSVRAKTIRKAKADTTVLLSDSEQSTRAHAAMLARRSKPQSIADRLSGNAFHYRNWYYPGGQIRFPNDPKLHFVDRMYPMAEGGMLLIDEPLYVWEFERCDKKRIVMKELGHRYIVIMPNMTFDEAMMELDK